MEERYRMKISTKGRYAIRLMLDIAMNSDGQNVSLKDVSTRQNISLKYLEQIVNMLSKAGYLKSQRGSQGGYRMMKSPDKYTVGDILRVTEGSLAPVSCLESEVNECDRYGTCSTIKMWEGLYKAITDYLDSVTISDLIERKTAMDEDLCYYI